MRADTAVITRLHYPKGKEFNWRFRFWKENVLPNIKNQTDKDFDYWVWCEKHHEHLFRELGINTFQVNHKTRFARDIHDYTDYQNVIGLPKYPIQINNDSDDKLSVNLVEKAKSLCEDKRTLISFQPVKVDIKTGKKYKMKNYRRRNKCSGNFAIYQPDLNNWRWLFYKSHYRLPDDPRWQKVIHVPEGYVEVMIHGRNHSTKISSKEKPI